MNGPEVAEAVRARLAERVPSRTVYVGAIPDGTLPLRYLLIRASEGTEESTRSCDRVSVQTPSIWVYSASRSTAPDQAAREAAWGAAQVRAALCGYRPEGRWAIRHTASAPVGRNDVTPETTFSAVEQFHLRSSI